MGIYNWYDLVKVDYFGIIYFRYDLSNNIFEIIGLVIIIFIIKYSMIIILFLKIFIYIYNLKLFLMVYILYFRK